MTTLTTLTGTEKQITWANEIRDAHLAAIDEAVVYMQSKIDARVESGQAVAEPAIATQSGVVSLRSWFVAQTEAAWWVNNRECLLRVGQASSNYSTLRGIVACRRFRLKPIAF